VRLGRIRDWVAYVFYAFWLIVAPILVATFIAMKGESGPIESFNRRVYPVEVTPGMIVTVESDVIRTKRCSSHVTRRWINNKGDTFVTEEQAIPLLPEGREHFLAKLQIPLVRYSGVLTLRTEVEFKCNIIQEYFGGTILPLSDVTFKVEYNG